MTIGCAENATFVVQGTFFTLEIWKSPNANNAAAVQPITYLTITLSCTYIIIDLPLQAT